MGLCTQCQIHTYIHIHMHIYSLPLHSHPILTPPHIFPIPISFPGALLGVISTNGPYFIKNLPLHIFIETARSLTVTRCEQITQVHRYSAVIVCYLCYCGDNARACGTTPDFPSITTPFSSRPFILLLRAILGG